MPMRIKIYHLPKVSDMEIVKEILGRKEDAADVRFLQPICLGNRLLCA